MANAVGIKKGSIEHSALVNSPDLPPKFLPSEFDIAVHSVVFLLMHNLKNATSPRWKRDSAIRFLPGAHSQQKTAVKGGNVSMHFSTMKSYHRTTIIAIQEQNNFPTKKV